MPIADTASIGSASAKLSSAEGDLDLIIDAVAFETPEIIVLDLVPADGGLLPPWTPGAHIDLVLESGLIRQYSLCGETDDDTRYRVAILRETAGRGGSAEIHATAQAGKTIRMRGPRNHFQLVDAPRYLFVAGGIGITPILPMIKHAEVTNRPWHLVYGGRSRSSMAFLTELAKRLGGELTLVPQDELGFPDLDGVIGQLEDGTAIFGCGPAAMLTALEAVANNHGRAASLHVERFTADPNSLQAAGAAEDRPFEVELRQSGLVLHVPADRKLGDVLQDANVPIPFSCQEGYCGSCETRVLEGVPDHRDTILTDAERSVGDIMMVCCGRSLTPRLVLDL